MMPLPEVCWCDTDQLQLSLAANRCDSGPRDSSTACLPTPATEQASAGSAVLSTLPCRRTAMASQAQSGTAISLFPDLTADVV